VAGRGDVFVVGGRSFAARHLGGAQLHRYVTDPALVHASPTVFQSSRASGLDHSPPAPGRSPLAGELVGRGLSLARHARGRDTGRSR
jgi:hypothetical protein